MTKITIIGVNLKARMETSTEFQEVLTKHGCIIKSRIGLHNIDDGQCSPSGVVLLELFGSEEEKQALENEINNLKDTEVQKMAFAQ